MAQSIRAIVPGGLARTAALNAGLPASTGISSLIRAAITMFVTGDIDKALESMERRSNAKTVGSLSRDATYNVGGWIGDIDSELADVRNKSQAVRAGLAMMAGWDKKDAEDERFVPPQGRPRKVIMTQ